MIEVNSILNNVNQLTQYVLDGCNTFDTDTLNKAMEIIMKQESTNISMLVYKHIMEREIAWRVKYASLQKEYLDIVDNQMETIEKLEKEKYKIKIELETEQQTVEELRKQISILQQENAELKSKTL